ncbi:hypothetical protein IP78_13660 [Brevundimonas sp. AAP58]|uniref:hypothetical protein n=1 Tax=Brevundimonas sp. AAP58 TaxID=1523422 RepID=UPI0006B979D0|nr:hypothetical protein [Brevundimonas sp. AAP58]KPF75223.1 hypothetical protein IP78_13660 [Brevundimonas sp. AAP58]
MTIDGPRRMHRRALFRIIRSQPSRTPLEREAELRVLKWMQLISSTSLILALIIWMVWLGER